jgi:hypothetical protein
LGFLEGESIELFERKLIANAVNLKKEELMRNLNFPFLNTFLSFVKKHAQYVEINLPLIQEELLTRRLQREESMKERQVTLSACERWEMLLPGYKEARGNWLVLMANSCCTVKCINQVDGLLSIIKEEYPEKTEDISRIEGKRKDVLDLIGVRGPAVKFSPEYHQRKIDRTDEENTSYRDWDVR